MISHLYIREEEICHLNDDIPVGFIVYFKDFTITPSRQIKLKTIHKEYVITKIDDDVRLSAEIICENLQEL